MRRPYISPKFEKHTPPIAQPIQKMDTNKPVLELDKYGVPSLCLLPNLLMKSVWLTKPEMVPVSQPKIKPPNATNSVKIATVM